DRQISFERSPSSSKTIVELNWVRIIEDNSEIEVGESRIKLAGCESMTEVDRAYAFDVTYSFADHKLHRVVNTGVYEAKCIVPTRFYEIMLCLFNYPALE